MIASLVDTLGVTSPGAWAYMYAVFLAAALFSGIGIPSLAICAGLNKWGGLDK